MLALCPHDKVGESTEPGVELELELDAWSRGGGAGDSAHRLPRSRPCGGGDAATTCGWPAPRLSALSQANGVATPESTEASMEGDEGCRSRVDIGEEELTPSPHAALNLSLPSD